MINPGDAHLSFQEFATWIFYGLLAFIMTYGVSILSKMRQSIDLLNLRCGELMVRHEYQQKKNEEIDDALDGLAHRMLIVERGQK